MKSEYDWLRIYDTDILIEMWNWIQKEKRDWEDKSK